MSRTALEHEVLDKGVRFFLTEKPLIEKKRILPPHRWVEFADGPFGPALASLLTTLDEETEPGTESEDGVLLSHARIADLEEIQARRLGLPPATTLALKLTSRGTIDDGHFAFDTTWLEPSGAPAPAVAQTGALLRHNGRPARIPASILNILQATKAFNELDPDDKPERFRRLAVLTQSLPQTVGDALIRDGYLQALKVHHAAAFTLKLFTRGREFDFDPQLFGRVDASGNAAANLSDEATDVEPAHDPEPLLPPALQELFAKERFRQSPHARSTYTLKDGQYVFLEPALAAGLDVVRKMQKEPSDRRREFAKNPQRILKEELAERYDESDVEALFVPTLEFSERVIGLGVWEPVVLPWITRKPNTWTPEKFGLLVDGQKVEFNSSEAIREAGARIEVAMRDGAPNVSIQGVDVPASPKVKTELERGAALLGGAEEEPEKKPDERIAPAPDAEEACVLLIKENLDELGFTRAFSPRTEREIRRGPSLLATSLKPHQDQGLDWLVRAWRQGRPGVLLADDMGLGKTLACLAFLAWLREFGPELGRPAGPLLVVAPTGLLGNWLDEHAKHLDAPGLGEPIKAFGPGLRALKSSPSGDLNVERLAQAAWVLTTYETLRDYETSFAVVRFGVVVYDEMQKLKNPTSQLCRVAKALNADFTLGLTGTPIENRVEDLWTLMDVIQPGLFGPLRAFSKTYAESDLAALKRLKVRLETDDNGLAPVMLRRMKTDILEGLPSKTEQRIPLSMPPRQAAVYEDALTARGRGKGAMLKTLQTLRRVSLHPRSVMEQTLDAAAFVEESARLKGFFDALDHVARKGEKALVFLESRELQPILAFIIQKRFRLPGLPAVINGAVFGPKRQEYVRNFQRGPDGFDVMILSPKAAGVGLTLTAANHVFHLSRWWNPAVEDQCNDRVYRIGQSKDVFVHLPMAIHPDPQLSTISFDQKLDELLTRKRSLSRDVLAPPESLADVQELFTSLGLSDSADSEIDAVKTS